MMVDEDDPTTTSGNILTNNTDIEGNNVTPTLGMPSGGGSVSYNPGDSTISYMPPANFNGLDTVPYVVCDAGVPSECVNDTLFLPTWCPDRYLQLVDHSPEAQ